MMKLSQPSYSFKESIDGCLAGIKGVLGLERRLRVSEVSMLSEESKYIYSVCNNDIASVLPEQTVHGSEPAVVNLLKRSDLIKIYDQYFVPERKPARKIYDSLMSSAKGECPFCGGIGSPRNIDHFLPKANFPQFSFMPINLVPSCRDCNMGAKGSSYSLDPKEQIIQPYIDKDIFFSEQWIYAEYSCDPDGEPGDFMYRVEPPGYWGATDKDRVRAHFRDFDIGERYSTRAAQMLKTVLLQVQTMRSSGASDDSIIEAILEPGGLSAPFPNHWQRGFYQALKDKLGQTF